MRYQVPQFIEIEDKVVGPFTIKQFIYIVGGAGLSFVLYSILPIYIAILLIVPLEALSLALAFYKINNKPFVDFLESAFMYYTKDNLYIWKKQDKEVVENKETKPAKQVYVPRLSESKLKDLAWSLGVSDNANQTTKNEG